MQSPPRRYQRQLPRRLTGVETRLTCDRIIPWVVCGGSGFSLRRQRKEGDVLEEYGQPVAKSHLFLGRSGHGSQKRRPYSALRVDVTYKGDDTAPTFVLRPLISERVKGAWNAYEASTIVLK